MINFIDENGRRHGALAEASERKAVNGEKSLSGTVYTNDEVIHGIDKGWKIYFNNEYYVITFAVPIDNGDSVEIEFDAVHEFFYEFSKSVVYDLLEGSNTMISYLDFIFADSGYSYDLEIDVPAFSKESFGMENRLSLFKDVIKSTGVEFSVNNRVVRILRQVGTDLSTVVKKGFNMQELRLEKNINDFITYKRGFGRFDNEDDPSLGRLEAEYESPLAAIYGRLEGDPVMDERYSVLDNLIDRLEQEVESSYSISVQLTMEDLTKAGYQYKQPREGDYISAINERLGFNKKIRIVSYESYYDSNGQLVDHRVTCNSLGIVDKLFSNDAGVRVTANQALKDAQKSLEVANYALVSADGKSMNYYGETDPVELGNEIREGDRWYQTIGEETKLKYWNGAEWQENKVSAGSLAGVLDAGSQDLSLINLNADSISAGSLNLAKGLTISNGNNIVLSINANGEVVMNVDSLLINGYDPDSEGVHESDLRTYLRYESGIVELGEENAEVLTQFANDEWAMLRNGEKMMWLEEDKINIRKGHFFDQLRVGNFGFVPRANGSLDFKKVSD